MSNNKITPEPEMNLTQAMDWLKQRIEDSEGICAILQPDKSKWSDFDRYSYRTMQMEKVIYTALQDNLKIQPENKPLAKWLETPIPFTRRCSSCLWVFKKSMVDGVNYCPRCGAGIEEEVNE